MLKAKVSDNEYEIEFAKNQPFSGKVNGKDFKWDVLDEGNGKFHILHNNTSYKAQILSFNKEEKSVLIKLNGKRMNVQVEDRFDLLLKKMGLDNLNSAKISELKAPMPGLVLDIAVAGGSQVKKGDPLIVLEAMKMENVLKSPADLTVKSVAVEKGTAVEKNTVLINFE